MYLFSESSKKNRVSSAGLLVLPLFGLLIQSSLASDKTPESSSDAGVSPSGLISRGDASQKPSEETIQTAREDSCAAADVGNWRMVFHDDFEIDGAPNADRWVLADRPGPPANGERQHYRPENVYVENNKLFITAVKKDYTSPVSKKTYHYTSGHISTRGKFDFTYGKVVMRAKLSPAQGSWNAMWLYNTKYDVEKNPRDQYGEIDMVENANSIAKHNVAEEVTMSTHYGDTNDNNNIKSQDISDAVPSLYEGFRTYTFWWNKNNVNLKIDNRPCISLPLPQQESLHEPHILIMNLAVGGDWGGPPDFQGKPTSLVVESVYVYQK